MLSTTAAVISPQMGWKLFFWNPKSYMGPVLCLYEIDFTYLIKWMWEMCMCPLLSYWDVSVLSVWVCSERLTEAAPCYSGREKKSGRTSATFRPSFSRRSSFSLSLRSRHGSFPQARKHRRNTHLGFRQMEGQTETEQVSNRKVNYRDLWVDNT